MKAFILVLAVLPVLACNSKPTLMSGDIEYIQTTVDLLRARANFLSGEDSVAIKRSLDSVYLRHNTSAGEYQRQSAALANDPKHAEAVFSAISDSISKK